MLRIINNLSDGIIKYLKDDPVRPEIPVDFRVDKGREIMSLLSDNDNPEAIVCLSYHDFVPVNCEDLKNISPTPSIVIFYTIWSYKPGAGRKLLQEAVNKIKTENHNIKRFVTLSPKTELAKKFHLKNGAIIYRENPDTINYEYL